MSLSQGANPSARYSEIAAVVVGVDVEQGGGQALMAQVVQPGQRQARPSPCPRMPGSTPTT